MERIGVEDLNQNPGRVLARVTGGETIEITDRGHPVARLVPIGDNPSTLARLVAKGRALAPTSGGPVPLPPDPVGRAVDAAAELATGRSEERW